MVTLQALIDRFLLQNKVFPEFCDVTEEDMVMWVRENMDFNVCALMVPEQNITDIEVFRHNSWTRW